MKILRYVLLMLLIITNITFANFINLNGVETTTVGSAIVLPQMVSCHTADCYFTSSNDTGVTALTFSLEGSLDNSHWDTLATWTMDTTELSLKYKMIHVVNKAVTYVRTRINTLTENGTTAVYTRYNFKKD